MSIIEVLKSATWITKSILFILLVLSVASWAVMFSEYVVLRRLSSHVLAINNLVKSCSSIQQVNSYLRQHVLISVFVDIIEKSESICRKAIASKRSFLPSEIMVPVHRCADDAVSSYVNTIGSHINYLSIIGAISPYIGLLGTIWGIVSAFQGFSDLSRVTLSQVAPDISEALVSTAASLLVAIPAVVAHSRMNLMLDELVQAICDFKECFLLHLHMHLISGEEICWKDQTEETLLRH
ncbi:MULTISPECIES: MotA/TolQ/ExbB proton channel family protein [Candidatus Ichthyocystis]|uniref:Putative proton translocator, TolQ family n=1 Tax=Candidatus Ichthyocystis hellenicum TaxID=1561003 RepID=A0A0S4M1Z5_9BURK|nr:MULTISPECIES: MotA/TolQ/ExbB proton channel family protein [Ichthyocystis]CUT17307.1 putative proton translocator, TolQ family [Candidatus Ichthyocystis hellenicum]